MNSHDREHRITMAKAKPAIRINVSKCVDVSHTEKD